jgi:hypothetical protein
MKKKSGLADSPFFNRVPVHNAEVKRREPVVPQEPTSQQQPTELQTARVTDIQTSRLPNSETSRQPEKQSSRLTDFDTYDVPSFQKMQRIEVRLTWEQNKFLDDMEALIGRDAPEGDKSDPSYRRITKNSIIRVLVEIIRALDIQVDASRFKNERDLLNALYVAIKNRTANQQTSRLPE